MRYRNIILIADGHYTIQGERIIIIVIARRRWSVSDIFNSEIKKCNY